MRIPRKLKFESTIQHRRIALRVFGCSKVIWQYPIPTEGKVNNYVCRYGHTTVTIHADEGVTPFMIECHFCGVTAQSRFYQCDQNPKEIHGVWAKDPNSWWGTQSQQKEHAGNGGVFLYAIQHPTNEGLV